MDNQILNGLIDGRTCDVVLWQSHLYDFLLTYICIFYSIAFLCCCKIIITIGDIVLLCVICISIVLASDAMYVQFLMI